MISKSDYRRLNLSFQGYLERTSHRVIRIKGVDVEGRDVECSLPYVHRWTLEYYKRVLYKFYCLNQWYVSNHAPVTMITLTVAQRHHTIDAAWTILRQSLRKLLSMMRKRIFGEDLSYFWVTEPHKTGYPHVHLCLFREVTQDQQDEMRRIWSKYLKAGNQIYGLDFQSLPELENIKNYLMKYLMKTLNPALLSSQTMEYKYFTYLAWEGRIRLMGFSRDISATYVGPKYGYRITPTSIELYDMLNDYSNLLYPSSLLLPSEDSIDVRTTPKGGEPS